ncbi:hypothetical protein CWO90_33505 [Bradyrhizobium sp. Leo121]|nr:hypothetical protein CWO90_33505 [Bradyrhizobium sp. Leo121]
MPARLKRDKRRRSAHITPEAVQLFRQGHDMLRGPHDPYELRDLKVALAAALGRSKFAASPLEHEPRSLIGGDREAMEVVLELQAQLLAAIGEARMP